jgi:tRNA(Ile)-lysidine synthase
LRRIIPLLQKISEIFPPSANARDAPEHLAHGTERSIGAAEFAALIDAQCPIPRGDAVAVAVSGGADSMALALLAHAWTRATGRVLRTVTVDHRLRSGSGSEAAQVGAWLGARGIGHEILSWTGEKPASGVQEAARAARYSLIAGWARARAIRHVLVAHHLDDQAETVLMRLARGSGITGLAGMRSVTLREGVRVCRPLLTVPGTRLRATLRAAGQDWIEDPSNESVKFARTHYRRLNAILGEHDAGSTHIAEIARSFARLDALMEAASRRVLGEGAVRLADGTVTLPQALYIALPEPVAGRVLRDILAEVGGKPLAPRGDRLARAQARLRAQRPAGAFTLGGCRIRFHKGAIRVSPEPGRSG